MSDEFVSDLEEDVNEFVTSGEFSRRATIYGELEGSPSEFKTCVLFSERSFEKDRETGVPVLTHIPKARISLSLLPFPIEQSKTKIRVKGKLYLITKKEPVGMNSIIASLKDASP